MHEIIDYTERAMVDTELERKLLLECICMGMMVAGAKDHRKCFVMDDSQTDVLDIRQKTDEDGLILHEAVVTTGKFQWKARQYEIEDAWSAPEFGISGNRDALAMWLLDRKERQ